MRICIPIVAETEEQALRKMAGLQPEDSPLDILFELRMDRMKKVGLERILEERKKKIVVTNRRREEGGGFQGPEKERVSLIRRAVLLGADFVDIEASTDRALLADVKAAIADQGHRTLLIVSFHDFEKTPSERALIEKLEECFASAPDIVKIVTFAHTDEDNLKTLRLIPYAQKRGREIISFCMGEKGRIGRVMSLFLGAYMGFATLGKEEDSAPGQLSLGEMNEVLATLTGGNKDLREGLRERPGKERAGV